MGVWICIVLLIVDFARTGSASCVYDSTSTDQCLDPALQPAINTMAETYGPGSRCVEVGFWVRTDGGSMTFSDPSPAGGCYQYSCSADTGVTIMVLGNSFVCSRKGEVLDVDISVSGVRYQGTLICPSCAEICFDELFNCPELLSVELSFEQSIYRVSEDVGSEDLALYVCLTADSIDRPFTATITPQSGTAIADEDFVATPENIEFDVGNNVRSCGCVGIIDDLTDEQLEVFQIVASVSDELVVITGQTTATVEVTDNTNSGVCNPECLNGGVCSLSNTCDCSGTGYIGNQCEIAQCDQECLNGGVCSQPNTCDCSGTGYTGNQCETAQCDQECLNGGVCSQPNTCDCSGTGYTGNQCQTAMCDPECQNGGVCSQPNTCDCSNTAFTGDQCQTESSILFVNNSPRVTGNMVSADFMVVGPFTSVLCGITTVPTPIDCSSGSVEYTGLNPNRGSAYTLQVTGTLPDGSVVELVRNVHLDTIAACWVHFINNGITINGDSVTFEWEGTGPGADQNLPFDCKINEIVSLNNFTPCTSPYTVTSPVLLLSGQYTLVVRTDPQRTVCTRRFITHLTFQIP